MFWCPATMPKSTPGGTPRRKPLPRQGGRISGPSIKAEPAPSGHEKTRRKGDNPSAFAYRTGQSVHVLDTNFPRSPFRARRRWSFAMDIIQELNKEQLEKLSAGKTSPDFGPGATLIVNL